MTTKEKYTELCTELNKLKDSFMKVTDMVAGIVTSEEHSDALVVTVQITNYMTKIAESLKMTKHFASLGKNLPAGFKHLNRDQQTLYITEHPVESPDRIWSK